MENVTVTVKADITNLKTAMKEAEKISKQTQKVIQSGWEQAADRVAKSFSRIADESNRMNASLASVNTQQVVAGIADIATQAMATVSALSTTLPALKGFGTALNASLGVISLVATAISTVVGLAEQWSQSANGATKTIDAFGDTAAELVPTFEDCYESINKMNGVDITAGLEKNTKTVAANMDLVNSGTENFVTQFGKIILQSEDITSAIEEVSGSFENLQDSVINARREALNFQIWEIINSDIDAADADAEIGRLIELFNAFEDGIRSTGGSFQEWVANVSDGTVPVAGMTDSLRGMKSEFEGMGITIMEEVGTFGESLENLKNRYTEADDLGNKALQETMKTTNKLFGEETYQMIQNSANALGAYYENVETCAESTYKNVEALKTEGEQLQEKNSLLMGLAQQYLANNTEFIELTAEQLEIMGEADAEKIKNAENYYITISELQAQSRTDIAANEDEYNAARNGVEQELRDNRIAAAQDLASTMKEITSGMTAEQIDDFARMAEQMGVEVDNGYLDFLKKTILFGDNLSSQLESGSEGAAETFIDKYVTLMNGGFTGVEQTAETSTEKVIGTIESSNSNMPKIEIKVNTPKLPKFSLNDSFDIARGIVPKIFISGWYDKGGYFNSPQIIGIAERRPEFVGAADDLESFIGKAVNNAFVRIDPALLHDIGSIGGNEPYSGSSVDFRPQITINTQKLTDAEMKRATDYISREFAKTVTGRKVGRLQ